MTQRWRRQWRIDAGRLLSRRRAPPDSIGRDDLLRPHVESRFGPTRSSPRRPGRRGRREPRRDPWIRARHFRAHQADRPARIVQFRRLEPHPLGEEGMGLLFVQVEIAQPGGLSGRGEVKRPKACRSWRWPTAGRIHSGRRRASARRLRWSRTSHRVRHRDRERSDRIGVLVEHIELGLGQQQLRSRMPRPAPRTWFPVARSPGQAWRRRGARSPLLRRTRSRRCPSLPREWPAGT